MLLKHDGQDIWFVIWDDEINSVNTDSNKTLYDFYIFERANRDTCRLIVKSMTLMSKRFTVDYSDPENTVLLDNGTPVELAQNVSREAIQEAYDAMVTQLENVPNMTFDSYQKCDQAIKGLAANQLKLAKFIYNNLV